MLNVHTRVLVLLAVLFGAATAQEHYNPATGHFYRRSNSTMNLSQARAYAALFGGHLVTINDAAETAFIQGQFGNGPLLIGLTDTAVEGTFVWDSGEPVSYTDWCPGEPNNVGIGGEDAVTMSGSGTASCWNDVPVTLAYFAVIEYEPAPPLVQWNFNPATGTYYHFAQSMPIADARAAAASFGGHLVSITSPAEQTFVQDIYGAFNFAIGLTDVAQEGVFVWDSMEPTSYTDFCPGQPDNNGNEDLVLFTSTGCWNDVTTIGNRQFLIETSDASAARILSSFEFGASTAIIAQSSDSEGWTTSSGTFAQYATISGYTAPHGSRWLRVEAVPEEASEAINAFNAASVDFNGTGVAQARFNFVAETGALAFDWVWSCLELPMSFYNDFVRVSLVLPGSDTIVALALYVDTYSPLYASPFTPRLPAVVRIPTQYLGQSLALLVEVGNQGDDNADASFYIDNVRLLESLPGNSNEVFVDGASGSNGIYLPIEVETTAFDILSIRLTSTNAIYRASPPALFASIGATGVTPPSIASYPDIHIDPTGAILVFNPYANPFGFGALPVGGLSLGYIVPPGLGGATIRFQYLSLSSVGPNGIFASSTALSVIVLP